MWVQAYVYCGITGWFFFYFLFRGFLHSCAKTENCLHLSSVWKVLLLLARKPGRWADISFQNFQLHYIQPGMRLTCVHNISIHLSSPPSQATHLRIIFLIDCTSPICLVLSLFLNAPPCSVVYSQATYELTHLLYAEKSDDEYQFSKTVQKRQIIWPL